MIHARPQKVSLRKVNRNSRTLGQAIVGMSVLLLLSAVYPQTLRAEPVKVGYLYNLSNFTGPLRVSAPRVSVDTERNEVSVLYQNLVRVFNDSGMEIYRFGDDLDVGGIVDLTSDKDGSILLLSYRWSDSQKKSLFEITRCNYRGEQDGKLELKGLPAELSGFAPSRMILRDGKLYLVNLMDLAIVVADPDGSIKKVYDVFSLLGLPEKNKGNTEMWGFSVDSDGSMLFTIPVLFTVYRLYPDGKIGSFGKPGGAPGRFNIVSGVVTDDRGNYLVVDKLKCTVLVFDKNYVYLNQFGFRGFKPGNLIGPDQIAIDKSNRIYVTQNGRRGVSVYKVSHD
jgi:hypothetical protein